jgi:ATP-dependent 26S proteasome regulatory subunit
VEDLRGSPLAVGNLEEMIDDNHAIISSSVGGVVLIAEGLYHRRRF